MAPWRQTLLLGVQAVWVCGGATYLGIVLFVLTWMWVVVAQWRRREMRVSRHTLEYTCLVTLVVQMYTNCMVAHPMLFSRAGGGVRCALDTVDTTEAVLQQPSEAVCGLGAYELHPMQALYALEPHDGWLFLTRRPGASEERLLSCAELGLSCFQWKVRVGEHGTALPPPLGMLRRIVLHDADALFVATSYATNHARALHRLQLAVGGPDGHILHVYSPLSGVVPLAATSVPGVAEVAALHADLRRGDVLVVVHRGARRRAPFVGVALSRFCTHNTDTCEHREHGNTYQFFRLARIAEVHRWSLFAVATACTEPLQSVCEVSLLASSWLLLGNQVFVTSLLLLLHGQRRGSAGHQLQRALVNVVCVFSVNWLCLFAIAFPPKLSVSRLYPYSCVMVLALLAQAVYSLYELARVDFGAGTHYITARPAHLNWGALLLQPAIFYTGSVYVQALAFTLPCVVYTLCQVRVPAASPLWRYHAVPTRDARHAPRPIFSLE